jgi:hypothetical protein
MPHLRSIPTGPLVAPLLGFLRARALARPVERRRDPRCDAAERPARLVWEVAGEAVERPAQVLDVSRGGARLAVPEPPPVGQAVRLYLEGAGPLPRVDATVLEVVTPPDRPPQLRLGFRGPCPVSFFRAIVLGDEVPVPAGADVDSIPAAAPDRMAG